MPLVATQVKRRRGTGVENDAFAGAEGEITVDLTNKELRVHDGSGKLGGFRIGRHTDRSNCITEIPQDIKLELNNGTLTLKAGSKIYIPNGPGVFDITTTQSDKVLSGGLATGREFVYLTIGGLLLHYADNSSGSDWNATSQYQCRYNTSANMIKNTNNTGSTWETQVSFPLAIITLNNGVVQSIDQVFNGFGYIGSTEFALPNLEYLCSNGRNSDGSLKNIRVKLTQVHFDSLSSSANGYISVSINNTGTMAHDYLSLWVTQDEEPTPVDYLMWYCPKLNTLQQYINGAWADRTRCNLGVIHATSGKIDSFCPKTAFEAVDYSNTAFIAHNAMPSNRYIEMTPTLTNGQTYIAPADGYICVEKDSSSAGQYIYFSYDGGLYSTGIIQPLANFKTRIMIPVRKRQSVQTNFNLGGTTSKFRFIYAVGIKE